METADQRRQRHAGSGLPPERRGLITSFAAVCGLLLFVVPMYGQAVLYNNGPDAEVGYYRINFGATTIDSFELSEEATLSNVTLTIYDVDDRNIPKYLLWTITTKPSGGTVLGSGFVGLSRLQDPYLTKFLFFAWKVGFEIPKLTIPGGTYYIQLQDVVTQWNSQAFWAVSSGPSLAYHGEVGPSESAAAQLAPVASESFAILGEWTGMQH